MEGTLNTCAGRAPAWAAAALGAVRYRFFLLAGILPYGLGVATARRETGSLDWRLALTGLLGVVAVSVGIEGMNEYFDALHGGDRVFAADRRAGRPWALPTGVVGFTVALLVGLWLAAARGWPILVFAFLGGLAALSYLAPPVRLSHRGLGEAVIALAYGPGLTLGGHFLVAGRLSGAAALASALPALTMLALALVNELADYYGDRLVGKRNLVVRLGRRAAARLYGAATLACFGAMAAGALLGVYPPLLASGLVLTPLALANARTAVRNCEQPMRLRGVVRGAIALHVAVGLAGILAYAW